MAARCHISGDFTYRLCLQLIIASFSFIMEWEVTFLAAKAYLVAIDTLEP